MSIPFQDGDRVVVIGERLHESGEASSAWLRRLGDLLIAREPGRRVDIVDRCAPEQTLHQVRQRWDDDVAGFAPQWAVIILGLSDTWHTLRTGPEHMPPAAFETALAELVEHHRSRFPDCRFVLIDQPFYNSDRDPAWNTGQVWSLLPDYHAAMKAVAERLGCLHVDTQSAVDERLAAEGNHCFGGDDQHPEQEGSLLLAHDVLRALGTDFPAAPAGLRENQTLVFIGDSITDAGRRNPANRPYGVGYMRLWQALLRARAPQLARSLQLVNRGIGGNTIRNLRHRWQVDCLDHAPDHLVVKIGINDLNRWLSQGADPVSPEDYEQILDELLTRARERNPKLAITLLSPFYLSRDANPKSYRYRVLEVMPRYLAALRRVGEKHSAAAIDLHAAFQQQLDHRPHTLFGGNHGMDIVHPSETGGMIIAENLYAGMN